MDGLQHRKVFPMLVAVLLASGCGSGPDRSLPLTSSSLDPYLTPTLVTMITSTVPATNVPIPTATPFIYKVAGGDTMSGIAARFGVRLDDLVAANAGVVPEALSVGQALKIPASAPAAGNSTAPTPVAASVGAVSCHPLGGGLYCLAPVHNPLGVMLEDVGLSISLVDSNGTSLASQGAFLPLDILPGGATLPAYAFFPDRVVHFQPVAQLVSSIRLKRGDARYLPAAVRNVFVSVDWNGRSAQVQGQIILTAAGKTAHRVWLAGVAYERGGQVIGFRRWEWQGELRSGQAQAFAFSVYSLGAPIEKVDVIVEAKP
jgi:LysM repeat protein